MHTLFADILRHNSKTPHVLRIPDFDLKPAQILENAPSPVLAKSPTSIGQNANRYWPNRQPILAKLPTGIDEIVYHENELATEVSF